MQTDWEQERDPQGPADVGLRGHSHTENDHHVKDAAATQGQLLQQTAADAAVKSDKYIRFQLLAGCVFSTRSKCSSCTKPPAMENTGRKKGKEGASYGRTERGKQMPGEDTAGCYSLWNTGAQKQTKKCF